MSLTPTQKTNLIEAYDALKNRQMVYLAGRNNGKTRVISRLQESRVIAETSGRSIVRARHKEDNEIEFVSGAFYGRSDRVTPYVFMRAILVSLGQKCGHMYYDIAKQFEETLWHEFAKQGRVLALAIDNGDLMCEKSFTILKYLNEFRRERKDIGVACVVAGEFGKMRMPMTFLKRTTEIQIGPISAASDIAQLIETIYPGESAHFTEASLRHMKSQSETTLDLRHTIAQVIRQKRQLRMDEVDVELVNLALAA